MSQVKNLRAMFENKGDTSPPDRGRSPGVSSTRHIEAASSSGSPRPLSKVRTNFVAIEKDGRIGLRRDHSGESSLSRRRMSNETADTEFNSNFLEKINTVSSDDVNKSSRRNLANETIPESPRTMSLHAGPVAPVDKGLQPNKTFMEPEKQPDSSSHFPSDCGGVDSVGSVKSDPAVVSDIVSGRKNSGHPAAHSKMPTKGPRKGIGATSAARPESKLSARGQPASKLSADKAQKSNANSGSSIKMRTVPSGAASQPEPIKTNSHNDAGFVKPKAKSPTKPVRLPSSLTAPTASSVSKTHGSHQSPPHQAGNQNNSAQTSVRVNSSNSGALQSAVKRQGSTASRARPSLGLPPSKQSFPTASQKRQSNVDEGFLARMMRPTQSSSSKTTEKAPVTPPRKTSHRPAGGEQPTQALPRSGSSRGLHKKPTMGTGSLKQTPTQQAEGAEEVKQPKFKHSSDELLVDGKTSSQTAEVQRDADKQILGGESDDTAAAVPSAQETTKPEDMLAEPEELDISETPTSDDVLGTGSALDNAVFQTNQVHQQADQEPETAGSEEAIGQNKQQVPTERREDVAPQTRPTEELLRDAKPVDEEEEISEEPIQDAVINAEESTMIEKSQGDVLVEAGHVDSYALEKSILQVDIADVEKHSPSQELENRQNGLVPEVEHHSPLGKNQTQTGVEEPEAVTGVEENIAKQTGTESQNPVDIAEVVEGPEDDKSISLDL